MYESLQEWRDVDDYFVTTLVGEDDALTRARHDSKASGLPPAEVAPNQGAFLSLLVRMAGGRRVLEIGTLGGYSTIWLARAVGPDGRVTTLEISPACAKIARQNLDRAGIAGRVEVVVGPATESLTGLVERGVEPFDVVFIDADKPSNPRYLEAALRLTRTGSVIIADNVVRDGAIIDAASGDDRVDGVRRFLEMLRDDPRLDATALQTVGSKGWDGFAIALVTQP